MHIADRHLSTIQRTFLFTFVAAVAFGVLATTACERPPADATTPEGAIRVYLEALREGDVDAAYAMMATSLQAVKEGIVNAYETKTGLSRARLSKLMTDETWMDAQKAVDLGFVDEVVQQEKKLPIVIPQNAAVVNALGNYSKVPAAILEAIAGCSITAPVQLSDDEQREADALSKRVSKITKKEM